MGAAIINGLVTGTVPALLAVGLVLVYKGSRVFSFAQAEFGTIAGYVGFLFLSVWKLPYAVGAILAVAVAALVGFGVERLVVQPLFNAPRVTLCVATVGVTLLIAQTEGIVGHIESRSIGPALGGLGPSVLGVRVSPQKFLIFAVLAGVALGFALFFSRTNLGLAILATSQDASAAELVGISSRRISSLVWTMAAALGGVAGLLQAGSGSAVLPGYMSRNFLLAAFAAAVLGGMTSLPGAFIGGELIGLSGSLAEYANGRLLNGAIPGPGNLVLFALVLVVLLVRPQGLLGQPESTRV